jgi:arylsulfatase A-like enzyme
MVQHLDTNVGRLLDALEMAGVENNTAVILTSDNGGLATSEGSPTCNSPLSEGKGWMFEGGNRVPLIIDWPRVTEPDDMCDTPVITPDIYSTILDIAGAEPPADQPVDGESLRSLLGGDTLDRKAIFWHYPHYGHQGGTPAGAIRTGRWKLIEFYEDERVVLFDLENDVREARDLSEYQDERVQRLRKQLAVWREDVDADMPESNPNFEPWEGRLGAGH